MYYMNVPTTTPTGGGVGKRKPASATAADIDDERVFRKPRRKSIRYTLARAVFLRNHT